MIEGVLAASVTPLTKNLTIDIRRFAQHSQLLLEKGCNAVVIFGTTGEANSFSVRERITALENLTESPLDMTRFIVGTGCCAVDDTVELTRHSLQSGVSGVLMLPPFYYKKITDDGLLAYFAKVIEKTASEKLKIYLYNFPQMTGISFSHDLIGMLRRQFPDNIAGIKDSSGNFDNMKQMVQLFPGFQVFSGTERYLEAILENGGAGCISATVNVTVKMAAHVFNKWRDGSDTEQAQERLSEIRDFIEKFPVIPAIKQILCEQYRDENLLYMKPPHLPLTKTEKVMLLQSELINLLLSGSELSEKEQR